MTIKFGIETTATNFSNNCTDCVCSLSSRFSYGDDNYVE